MSSSIGIARIFDWGGNFFCGKKRNFFVGKRCRRIEDLKPQPVGT